MAISDFVVIGVAESADEVSFGLNSANKALLSGYHNPRRSLLHEVVLTSDHKHSTDFITSDGVSVISSKCLSGEDMAWLKCHYASALIDKNSAAEKNDCTDFVVLGEVELHGEQNTYSSSLQSALLGNNPRRALRQPLALTSDHKGCTEFFIMRSEHGLLCSTNLTSADVMWIERTKGLAKGSLFAALQKANREEASTTELPWEPMARYNAMARHTRVPRGSKSVEHLRQLRISDPTINISGWHDWSALYAQVKSSWLVKVNAQAQIDRAMAGHRVATRQRYPVYEPKYDRREERKSSDSVISFLESDAPSFGFEPTSPFSVLDTDLATIDEGNGWVLDKKLSYSDKLKGVRSPNKLKAPPFVEAVKGGAAERAEFSDVVWFEGVAYIKSEDGMCGYSSS